MKRKIRMFLLLQALLLALSLGAQPLQKLSVKSFGLCPLDMTAQSDEYKEIDANGTPYAIVKVVAVTPGDSLRQYMFDFGYMNHKLVKRDDVLWLYVQQGAKHVTISRKGYEPVKRYSLQTSLEGGRTYELCLQAAAPAVYTQMVTFAVTPRDSKAVVMIADDAGNTPEEMLGTVDANGSIAKNLKLGTYSYRVMAEGYYTAEGQLRLTDPSSTCTENIALRARFAQVTLAVNADADIYVNNELKDRRTWTGRLNAGSYRVECRQPSHKPSSITITVEEDKPLMVRLPEPQPITGVLSLISQPLGAAITIDGKPYGKTARNIDSLLIGSHTVTFSLQGFDDAQHEVTVKEGEVTNLNVELKKAEVRRDTVEVEPEEEEAPQPVVQRASGLDFALAVGGKQIVFRMIPVEGGSFLMGSDTGGAYSNEAPPHSVQLTDAFLMGETEVTQELWQAVMGKNPSKTTADGLPVDRVSWDDCQKFVERLSEMLTDQLGGRRFRLPTEAEWEYAARGGSQSMGYAYAGGNSLDGEVAWYEDNAGKTAHAVMQRQPNELGLFDMSGNVQEWCQDRYGQYAKGAQTDPKGAAKGFDRVVRGGSYSQGARECRVTYRGHKSASSRANGVGLRLAL